MKTIIIPFTSDAETLINSIREGLSTIDSKDQAVRIGFAIDHPRIKGLPGEVFTSFCIPNPKTYTTKESIKEENTPTPNGEVIPFLSNWLRDQIARMLVPTKPLAAGADDTKAEATKIAPPEAFGDMPVNIWLSSIASFLSVGGDPTPYLVQTALLEALLQNINLVGQDAWLDKAIKEKEKKIEIMIEQSKALDNISSEIAEKKFILSECMTSLLGGSDDSYSPDEITDIQTEPYTENSEGEDHLDLESIDRAEATIVAALQARDHREPTFSNYNRSQRRGISYPGIIQPEDRNALNRTPDTLACLGRWLLTMWEIDHLNLRIRKLSQESSEEVEQSQKNEIILLEFLKSRKQSNQSASPAAGAGAGAAEAPRVVHVKPDATAMDVALSLEKNPNDFLNSVVLHNGKEKNLRKHLGNNVCKSLEKKLLDSIAKGFEVTFISETADPLKSLENLERAALEQCDKSSCALCCEAFDYEVAEKKPHALLYEASETEVTELATHNGESQTWYCLDCASRLEECPETRKELGDPKTIQKKTSDLSQQDKLGMVLNALKNPNDDSIDPILMYRFLLLPTKKIELLDFEQPLKILELLKSLQSDKKCAEHTASYAGADQDKSIDTNKNLLINKMVRAISQVRNLQCLDATISRIQKQKRQEIKQFQISLASLKRTHTPMMQYANSIASDDRIDDEGVRTRLSKGLNEAIEQDIRDHHADHADMLWDCLSQYAEQAPADDETVGDLSEETPEMEEMAEILKKHKEIKQFQRTLASLKQTHAPMMQYAKSIASDDCVDDEEISTRLSDQLNQAIEQDIRDNHAEHADMLWDCLSQYAEQASDATDTVERSEDQRKKEEQLKQKLKSFLRDEIASYFKILKQEKKQKLYSRALASACVGLFLSHYLKTLQTLLSPKMLTILFTGMILATIISSQKLYNLSKKRKKTKESLITIKDPTTSRTAISSDFLGTKAERQALLQKLNIRGQRPETRGQRAST
jgi:hypothetical protein